MTACPVPSRFWYACVCGSVCVRQQNASNQAQRIVSLLPLLRCLFCSPLYIVPDDPVCEPHSLLSMERCRSCCVAFPGSVLGWFFHPLPTIFLLFSFFFCLFYFFLLFTKLEKNLKDCRVFVHNNHNNDKNEMIVHCVLVSVSCPKSCSSYARN